MGLAYDAMPYGAAHVAAYTTRRRDAFKFSEEYILFF